MTERMKKVRRTRLRNPRCNRDEDDVFDNLFDEEVPDVGGEEEKTKDDG